jgi:hypothetical protein
MIVPLTRKMRIRICLDSWGPLKEILEESLKAETGKIEQYCAKPLSEIELTKFNQHISNRNAILRVFSDAERLEEEYNSSPVDEPQQ